ncbi:MAG: protein translocase subunit SecF [Pseudomonadota bacterium]|nr:protein translocase subunit SecF [Pseudomonadota bacterium]MEC9236024.1 protein translocase subunit SecF [Pseudomonadota bacterium]MEE3323294.1 protein translocase subunit SecF [Pseudomonadota bacterium]
MFFKGISLIPENTNIDVIGKRKIAFVLSTLLIVFSIYSIATKGLNFGIDFTGGTVIEIQTQKAEDLAGLREGLNSLELGNVSLQTFGEDTDLLIRMPEQDGGPEAQEAAINKVETFLNEHITDGYEVRRTEFVGPQVGEELKKAGLLAIIFSLGGIMVYIWMRFEWQFGVAAIIALAHDAIATIGLFAILQMDFDLSTVAALLMIAGYSINDTVVVFDRIRETLRKYKKTALPQVFNMAINSTLSRTVMTSVTTLIALIALYLFGGEVIRGFVDALIYGVLIGTYSSVFVASPVLMFFNVRADADKEDEDGAEAEAAEKA